MEKMDMFDGKSETQGILERRSSEEVEELLKNWKDCPKPRKKQKRQQDKPLMKVWKTRSVFWELPYWKFLCTPHSLDIMHITKNVCESLVSTIINMPDMTKDGLKARNDLIFMGIRKELHGVRTTSNDQEDDDDHESETTQGRRKGKNFKKNEYYCPPSFFTLSQDEIKQFFKC